MSEIIFIRTNSKKLNDGNRYIIYTLSEWFMNILTLRSTTNMKRNSLYFIKLGCFFYFFACFLGNSVHRPLEALSMLCVCVWGGAV